MPTHLSKLTLGVDYTLLFGRCDGEVTTPAKLLLGDGVVDLADIGLAHLATSLFSDKLVKADPALPVVAVGAGFIHSKLFFDIEPVVLVAVGSSVFGFVDLAARSAELLALSRGAIIFVTSLALLWIRCHCESPLNNPTVFTLMKRTQP